VIAGIAGVLPQRKRQLDGRRIILVDIENLVGGGVSEIEVANAALAAINPIIGNEEHDQTVIGVSHFSALASGCARPNARLVMRSGKNGADLALLEVLECENIEERFGQVVLVSGDGIFTESVARLGSCGVRVTVVAREGSLSRRLRMAASESLTCTLPEDELGDAA
jgi:hypothetical protein